jgi:hypothetical protein
MGDSAPPLFLYSTLLPKSYFQKKSGRHVRDTGRVKARQPPPQPLERSAFQDKAPARTGDVMGTLPGVEVPTRLARAASDLRWHDNPPDLTRLDSFIQVIQLVLPHELGSGTFD